jgi:hypothetical protein
MEPAWVEHFFGGEMMPIVDGRYEAKISTTFATVEEGKSEIKKKIERARKIRVSNIPMEFLSELIPILNDKDVTLVLPLNEKPIPELKELGKVGTTKAKIYKDFKGIEAYSGSVNFADRIFNITWTENKILQIESMDYGKCVKCMNNAFEGGFRYSEKHY